MLDRTSKKVLNYIRSQEDCTFHHNKGYHYDVPYDEFCQCVDYLEESGYLTVKRVSDQMIVSATLTHKGRHPKEFNSIALKRYLLDKWVDILALIISILAFIGAYRHEISVIIRILMQALTG